MDCGSALAEAEVEYEDKKSDAIDVGFGVVDLKDLSARVNVEVQDPTDIVIWTTTLDITREPSSCIACRN